MKETCKIKPTQDRDVDGGIVYWWLCGFCGDEFKAGTRIIRNRSRKGMTPHCGCQTKLRMSKGNKGREPSNKKGDRHSLITHVLNSTKGRASDLNRNDVECLIFSPCHYCGCKPGHYHKLGSGKWQRISEIPRNGIDRKDSSKGYLKENCVSCCTQCNYLKRDMPYDSFLSIIHRIADNIRS